MDQLEAFLAQVEKETVEDNSNASMPAASRPAAPTAGADTELFKLLGIESDGSEEAEGGDRTDVGQNDAKDRVDKAQNDGLVSTPIGAAAGAEQDKDDEKATATVSSLQTAKNSPQKAVSQQPLADFRSLTHCIPFIVQQTFAGLRLVRKLVATLEKIHRAEIAVHQANVTVAGRQLLECESDHRDAKSRDHMDLARWAITQTLLNAKQIAQTKRDASRAVVQRVVDPLNKLCDKWDEKARQLRSRSAFYRREIAFTTAAIQKSRDACTAVLQKARRVKDRQEEREKLFHESEAMTRKDDGGAAPPGGAETQDGKTVRNEQADQASDTTESSAFAGFQINLGNLREKLTSLNTSISSALSNAGSNPLNLFVGGQQDEDLETVKTKALAAITEYRIALRKANERRKQLVFVELPRLCADLQAIEELRLASVKKMLSTYSEILNVNTTTQSAMVKGLCRDVGEIQTQKDLTTFIKYCRSMYGKPHTPASRAGTGPTNVEFYKYELSVAEGDVKANRFGTSTEATNS